jgi:hypothetical protein
VKANLSTPISALFLAAALLKGTACDHGSPLEAIARVQTGEIAGPLQLAKELSQFNDQGWDEISKNGWSYLRRTSSKDDDVIVDATAPFSPPHVLRIVFTPDMKRDHEPSVHWIGLPKVKEVFAEWWIKLSSNWVPSDVGGGKMTFLHAWPDGSGQVYSGIGGTRSPHRININTEWAPYGQKIWEPNRTSTAILYDRWYRISWHVKWATEPGREDGVLRWWIDGVLNGDHINSHFPLNGVGFQQFEFAPTLQRPPSTEQHMYVDHTRIFIR